MFRAPPSILPTGSSSPTVSTWHHELETTRRRAQAPPVLCGWHSMEPGNRCSPLALHSRALAPTFLSYRPRISEQPLRPYFLAGDVPPG